MPPGITLVQAENLEVWLLDIQVLDDNPIYKGETYRLKFNFSRNYPIEVRFLGRYSTRADMSFSRLPKLLSSATTPTRYPGTHTSTPTASSVSTSSTNRAGHPSTTSRAYASVYRACSPATRRKSGHRATRTSCGTTHSGRETSTLCSTIIRSEEHMAQLPVPGVFVTEWKLGWR
jgi:hypothetical protein